MDRRVGGIDASRFCLGTIGFSYQDWAGVFYPERVRTERRLSWYAERFGTVELDTTFYGMPTVERVKKWAGVVPEGFRFSLKMFREVTHEGVVGSPASIGLAREFVEVVRRFEGKLGAVLIQFPPSFTAVRREDLLRLLDALPALGSDASAGEVRYAVELRHDSWWSEVTVAQLRERGIAWVGLDQPTVAVAGLSPDDERQGGNLHAPRPVIVTSDFLYMRWCGNHGQIPTNDRELVDPTPRLRWWVQRLEPVMSGGVVGEVLGYFGNSYSGHAPLACRRMMGLLGMAVPEAEVEQQGGLFG
ncbi:MAG: DUF72 domain-containing protein [Planctomycetota bacterium]